MITKIQFQPDNIQKIIDGNKTTTIRSKKQFDIIGINEGETRIVYIGGSNDNINKFYVICLGFKSINEMGGPSIMIKSEGYNNISEIKYKQAREWFENKNKLYVYSISKNEPTSGKNNPT